MGKTIWVVMALVLFAAVGCSTISQTTGKNRTNLAKLSIGMPKQQVLDIMGTKTMSSGCHFLEGTEYKVMTINNPYRSELVEGRGKYEGKTLEVLFYATDVKKNDALITDDELTPMIFDDGRLIGWGWSFLKANAIKYEV